MLRLRFLPLCAFLVGCLLSCAPPSLAQSIFGSIVGNITDGSGAGVAGATISLTNVDENTSRTVLTDSSGFFQLLNLSPARYKLLTSMPGFASVQQDNIVLDARQQRRLDVTLQLASTQETVEITSDTAVLNTENATISQTLNNQEVTQLPSNYRGATTSPLGAIVSLPDVQQDSQGNISLAGGLVSMADYTLDGISTTNVRSNGPNVNMYPSSEMLQEFRVSAINNNAEFSSAGDVTVTSKSGANLLHGSVFEYLQNSALDATTYGSPTKQAKNWNTFGGSLSGPLVVPHLYDGHNKTFFFLDYEGNLHPGSTLQTYTVPTAGMRAGLLSAFPGGGTTLVDPSSATGQTYAQEGITQIPVNPVAQSFLTNYYPSPNVANTTIGNFREQVPLSNTTNGFDVRGDHAITSKQQLAVRWSWKDQSYDQIQPVLPSESVQQDNRNLLVSYNYIFTPALLNEFRFGLSNNVSAPRFPILGAQAISTLGLQGLGLSTSAQTFGGFPGFDFVGSDFTAVGLAKVGTTHSLTDEFTDNLSWIKGSHTLKGGVDFRYLNYKAPNNFAFSDDFGYFEFTGAFTGDPFADFLNGLPFLNFVAKTGPNINQSSGHFAAFLQDEYRVTKRLTLSYGLRWELLPPFSEASGNIANFNPATGDVVVPDKTVAPAQGFLYSINACSLNTGVTPCTKVVPASQEGFPQGLRYTYWKNFDPRISAAWRPFDDHTVIRAGIGVYTVQSLGAVAYQMTGIASTDFQVFVNVNPATGGPAFKFPQAVSGDGGVDASAIGSEIFDEGMDPHFRDPTSTQYNVTIDREVSKAWSARVSYIGMNSYRLPYTVDLNQVAPSTTPYSASRQPYSNFNQLFTVQNVANQNYQALETQATHSLHNGLFLQGTYTFAKNLGNAGGDAPTQLVNEVGFVNAPVGFADRFNPRADRGNDASTRRHRFLLTSLYQLPVGRGKTFLPNTNRILNAIVSDWQLSTISLLQSGPYQTPTISAVYAQGNMNEVNRGVIVRPDRIGSCHVANPGPNHWFNAAAFVPTPAGAGRIGNSGVGICEGPGTVAVAGGLSRTFPIHERLHARVEATFTNILNHPNFAPPNTLYIPPSDPNYATSTFGQTTTVQTAENAGNRTGQVSFRLDF